MQQLEARMKEKKSSNDLITTFSLFIISPYNSNKIALQHGLLLLQMFLMELQTSPNLSTKSGKAQIQF